MTTKSDFVQESIKWQITCFCWQDGSGKTSMTYWCKNYSEAILLQELLKQNCKESHTSRGEQVKAMRIEIMVEPIKSSFEDEIMNKKDPRSGGEVSEMISKSVQICKNHNRELEWCPCGDCEEGLIYHDCGEDICACLNPEPNVICEACKGEGGFLVCLLCVPEEG